MQNWLACVLCKMQDWLACVFVLNRAGRTENGFSLCAGGREALLFVLSLAFVDT